MAVVRGVESAAKEGGVVAKGKAAGGGALAAFLCLKDWKIFSNMDFSKLVGALSPIFMWLVMKKDSELPWVTRIARWVVLVFFTGYVAHCFKEWFL